MVRCLNTYIKSWKLNYFYKRINFLSFVITTGCVTSRIGIDIRKHMNEPEISLKGANHVVN
jgi:hypothetical protein